MNDYSPDMVRLSIKLSRLRQQRDVLEDAIRATVDEFKDSGASWVAVGGALGTSGQAAWERYSGNATAPGQFIPQETLPGMM